MMLPFLMRGFRGKAPVVPGRQDWGAPGTYSWVATQECTIDVELWGAAGGGGPLVTGPFPGGNGNPGGTGSVPELGLVVTGGGGGSFGRRGAHGAGGAGGSASGGDVNVPGNWGGVPHGGAGLYGWGNSGGQGAGSSEGYWGGGGGGGAYVKKTAKVTVGTRLTLNVPAGGAGGTPPTGYSGAPGGGGLARVSWRE